jgi:hypothetical protein
MDDLRPGRRFAPRRLAMAFTVALLSDGLSVLFAPTPPLNWATDVVTALLLFTCLGWQRVLLPGLILEAIPGLSLFPFWVLVVAAVAKWGTVRQAETSARESGGRHTRTAGRPVTRDGSRIAAPTAPGVSVPIGTRGASAGSGEALSSRPSQIAAPN